MGMYKDVIDERFGNAGFLVVIRRSFTLWWSGGGIAYNPRNIESDYVCVSLELSPTK